MSRRFRLEDWAFAPVPMAIIRMQTLTAAEVRLYALICCLHGAGHGSNSHGYLADELGVNPSTVKRAVKHLSELGLINDNGEHRQSHFYSPRMTPASIKGALSIGHGRPMSEPPESIWGRARPMDSGDRLLPDREMTPDLCTDDPRKCTDAPSVGSQMTYQRRIEKQERKERQSEDDHDLPSDQDEEDHVTVSASPTRESPRPLPPLPFDLFRDEIITDDQIAWLELCPEPFKSKLIARIAQPDLSRSHYGCMLRVHDLDLFSGSPRTELVLMPQGNSLG